MGASHTRECNCGSRLRIPGRPCQNAGREKRAPRQALASGQWQEPPYAASDNASSKRAERRLVTHGDAEPAEQREVADRAVRAWSGRDVELHLADRAGSSAP